MENIENNSLEENVEKKEGGYFGYYVFTFVSAIIGFVIMFFLTRIFIDDQVAKGNEGLAKFKMIIAVAVAMLAVILFVIIAINLKKIFKKIFLSEIFLYLYIGFLTTVLSIVVFRLLLNTFNARDAEQSLNWKIAEISAFVISVVFAFVADKIIVFKSLSINPFKVFSEFGMFLGGRLITEGINFAIMYIMIDRLNQDEFRTKIIACVIVIVLNYLLSKFIIFKKVKKDVVKEEVKPEIDNKVGDTMVENKTIEEINVNKVEESNNENNVIENEENK